MDVQGHFPDFRALHFYPDPETMAKRGRGVSVVFGLLLAFLLWTTARQMFSEGAANLALALFAFSPALIAHFSLITTDGAGVLFIFATAVQLLRWRHSPSSAQILLMGLVLGLLLLSKFYTPPMFLLALIWLLILKPEKIVANPRQWNWGAVVMACLVAVLILWSGYFFHISRLTMRNGQMIATFPNHDPIVKNRSTPIDFSILVPAGEYLEGLRNVAFHNHRGHKSFFLGIGSERGGWKSYYPTTIILKWPTVVLVLFLAVLPMMVRRRVRVPSDFWITASFPAVFFLFAIFSKIDIGDRHVLPLYPFVLLLTGASWQLAQRSRVILAMIVLAVVLHAADGLRYAPDYLSYFTPFVSSTQTYKLLSDSNLDWGQGLLALRKYELAHPREKMYVAYFGSVEPAAYGLGAEPLPEGTRVSGATVVVGATHLSGQMLERPDSYQWVLKYCERAILNHTLHVFAVP